MNIRKATRLNKLLTACSLFHVVRSLRAFSESLSRSGERSFLLIGIMIMSVNGITAKRKIAPANHQELEPIHQATIAVMEPMPANDACITAALW